MPSLRINLPHERFGRVNAQFTAPDDRTMRRAVGLAAVTEMLDREASRRSEGDRIVPLVLQIPIAAEWCEEQTVEEMIEEERQRAERSNVEKLAKEWQLSLRLSEWMTDDNWIQTSEHEVSYSTSSTGRLSSDSSSSSSHPPSPIPVLSRDSAYSSQHDAELEVAQEVRIQRARATSVSTGREVSPVPSESDLNSCDRGHQLRERARALATLEGTHDSTPSRHSRDASPSDSERSELESDVHFERARTLATLTGAYIPPPNRDYGDSSYELHYAFKLFHQQEMDRAEASQRLRSVIHRRLQGLPHMDYSLPSEPPTTSHGLAVWMHGHLWNHTPHLDRPLLTEWNVEMQALLLEVECQGCECGTLKVERVRNLNACDEEEFEAVMERVSERGWRDVIWVMAREEDFPMRIEPVQPTEKQTFEVKLMRGT